MDTSTGNPDAHTPAIHYHPYCQEIAAKGETLRSCYDSLQTLRNVAERHVKEIDEKNDLIIKLGIERADLMKMVKQDHEMIKQSQELVIKLGIENADLKKMIEQLGEQRDKMERQVDRASELLEFYNCEGEIYSSGEEEREECPRGCGRTLDYTGQCDCSEEEEDIIDQIEAEFSDAELVSLGVCSNVSST